MQIPILSGIYTDGKSDFRDSYPRNLIPVPKDTGISKGYLRPADGIDLFIDELPGNDRGAINWEDECYRVSGTRLIRVNANQTYDDIGDLGTGPQSSLDYSFDYLGVSSNTKLYLYDNATLTQVTDPDLGDVIDFIFIDGYFLTTDGEFLVVTELGNPFSVNPLKYGSSEIDPDPVLGLLKLRNQAYALNANTIEVYQNIGGDNFPFQRINGAHIHRGIVGTHAKAVFKENIAFVGGGRNEANSVWVARSGQSQRIATREIDQIILEYTELELSGIVCEARVDKGHEFLYIHLPDQTLVYDGSASAVAGTPIWFTLGAALVGKLQYPARNLVRCYDKWLVGDPSSNRVGELTDAHSSYYGSVVGWDFGTKIVYNDGLGALLHRVELVSLTGRAAFGDDPTIWTSYTNDGVTHSQEFAIKAGVAGDRANRLVWLQQGYMNNWRSQSFRGTSDAMISISRLEVTIEGLNT